MKFSIYTVSIAAICSLINSSCNTAEENTAPEITILSPTSNEGDFLSNEPITLNVIVTDDDELHEVSVSVVRNHDAAQVYSSNEHTHATEYLFLEDTSFNTSEASNFTLTVNASDHDGEEESKSEVFRVIP